VTQFFYLVVVQQKVVLLCVEHHLDDLWLAIRKVALVETGEVFIHALVQVKFRFVYNAGIVGAETRHGDELVLGAEGCRVVKKDLRLAGI
jgi:hypothetical protein